MIGKIIIIIIHEIKCDILGERWYHDPFVRIIETKIHGSGWREWRRIFVGVKQFIISAWLENVAFPEHSFASESVCGGPIKSSGRAWNGSQVGEELILFLWERERALSFLLFFFFSPVHSSSSSATRFFRNIVIKGERQGDLPSLNSFGIFLNSSRASSSGNDFKISR